MRFTEKTGRSNLIYLNVSNKQVWSLIGEAEKFRF